MPPAPSPATKPYVKLASRLVFAGTILFGVEQFSLAWLEGSTKSIHLDPNLLSAFVVVPILLVVAGAVLFVVGRMRRL
jgi:hypothetical protein